VSRSGLPPRPGGCGPVRPRSRPGASGQPDHPYVHLIGAGLAHAQVDGQRVLAPPLGGGHFEPGRHTRAMIGRRDVPFPPGQAEGLGLGGPAVACSWRGWQDTAVAAAAGTNASPASEARIISIRSAGRCE
jgi:hypothetical protein